MSRTCGPTWTGRWWAPGQLRDCTVSARNGQRPGGLLPGVARWWADGQRFALRRAPTTISAVPPTVSRTPMPITTIHSAEEVGRPAPTDAVVSTLAVPSAFITTIW